MAKIKDNRNLLREARKKQLVIYTGTSIRLSADLSEEKGVTQYIQSEERIELTTKNYLPRKVIIQIRRRDSEKPTLVWSINL